MKERVEIIKNLYPKYLILLKIKDKLKCIGIDKNIIETFEKEKLKKVNKIILNNLEIEKIEEYKNNEYEIYYVKYQIIKWLKSL